jgi:hypothetical protein
MPFLVGTVIYITSMYCTINRMEWNEGLKAGEKRTDARKRVNQYTGILFAHPKAISNWLYHRPPHVMHHLARILLL